jgi:hypothetical protein
VVDTSRIRSGFDVEVQIGAGWILVALQTLAAEGLLLPGGAPPPFQPDAEISVTDARIIFDQDDWDLEIDLSIAGFPVAVLAGLALSADGSELQVTNNQTDDVTAVPFGILSGLAGPPELRKLRGDGDLQPCFALLANLDIRAEPQSGDPLPEGEHVPRGEPLLAQTFLPDGADIAVGVGQSTFPRFANDIWHSQLRAEDGTHPLPDDEDPIGVWHVASCAVQSGRIAVTLVGEVPIDWWPDATVTIDVFLTPQIVDGAISFALELDTDIDTGLWGDLFAGIIGGLVGLLLGVLTGGALLPAVGIGFVTGVVLLEVGEAVAEGIVKRKVLASLEGDAVGPVLSCDNSLVVEATPVEGDNGIALGVLDAIPRSVTIATTDPDPLHHRHIQVVTDYDTVTVDGNGLAFTGAARAGEAFEPLPATLFGRRRTPAGDAEQLSTLVYQAADGSPVELSLADVLDRVAADQLAPPLRLTPLPAGADTHLPAGQLPVVCLSPTAIRRVETIVRDLQFTTGLDLTVAETVMLQDAGALVLHGLQLIHPSNADPYYRSAPDSTTDNNVESLPLF